MAAARAGSEAGRAPRRCAGPPPGESPHLALLEGDDIQLGPQDVEQFALAQQERWIRGLAEVLVADHEGFVNQYAANFQRVHDLRQQRPEQVVGDDNAVKDPAVIGPGTALEIRHARGNPWLERRQGGDGDGIAIHGLDLKTRRREEK